MTRPTHSRAIEAFVRNRLGCTCPEEVFEQISSRRLNLEELPLLQLHRLVIGQRLLIYIVAFEEPLSALSRLDQLLARGRRERDERGCNRFRLVLALPGRQEALELQAAFDRLAANDDRAHLHLLDPDEIPASLYREEHRSQPPKP